MTKPKTKPTVQPGITTGGMDPYDQVRYYTAPSPLVVGPPPRHRKSCPCDVCKTVRQRGVPPGAVAADASVTPDGFFVALPGQAMAIKSMDVVTCQRCKALVQVRDQRMHWQWHRAIDSGAITEVPDRPSSNDDVQTDGGENDIQAEVV